jgi:hypothetical protein
VIPSEEKSGISRKGEKTGQSFLTVPLFIRPADRRR